MNFITGQFKRGSLQFCDKKEKEVSLIKGIEKNEKNYLSDVTLNDERFKKVRSIQIQRFARRELYERDFGGINKVYWRKLLVYGNFADLLIYDIPKITHKSKGRKNYTKSLDTTKRDDSISRTKQTVFRLVHSNVKKHGNYKQVFFTLTFAENLQDVKRANFLYRAFIKRLNYFVGFNVEYVAIIEFQKRGAVHYHGVFFNLPFIDKDKFEKIWGNGFTNLQIFKVEKAISSYLTKYLTKDFFDKKLYGQRSVLTSGNLLRPFDTVEDFEIDYLLDIKKKIVNEYKSLNGSFRFKRYSLDKVKKLM